MLALFYKRWCWQPQELESAWRLISELNTAWLSCVSGGGGNVFVVVLPVWVANGVCTLDGTHRCVVHDFVVCYSILWRRVSHLYCLTLMWFLPYRVIECSLFFVDWHSFLCWCEKSVEKQHGFHVAQWSLHSIVNERSRTVYKAFLNVRVCVRQWVVFWLFILLKQNNTSVDTKVKISASHV